MFNAWMFSAYIIDLSYDCIFFIRVFEKALQTCLITNKFNLDTLAQGSQLLYKLIQLVHLPGFLLNSCSALA